MKFNLFFFLIGLLFAFECGAQSSYWIQFTDKGNSPFRLEQPGSFISERALSRRAVQHVAVDSLDLPVSPAYVTAVAATGVSIRTQSRWLNGVLIITSDSVALHELQQLPFVLRVSKCSSSSSLPQRAMSATTRRETGQPVLQPGLTITPVPLNYGYSFNQIDMLGGVCLHNYGYRGAGVVIAIIDDGFAFTDVMTGFDSLRANHQILGTRDLIQGDTLVYDDGSFGTQVLSGMAANLPGLVIGTAPDASYWLLRSAEANYDAIDEEYYWTAAAEFADSVGADLISSSLSYTTFLDTTQNHSYADMDGNTTPCAIAADVAASRGILVVCAVGDEGAMTWFYLGTPADADSVLAVGATMSNGSYRLGSSRGPSADGDVKPDVGAMGDFTVVAGFASNISYVSGTGMSALLVAGLAACLWQAYPGFTNMQVINAVRQSGTTFTAPTTYLGYGIPDFCAAYALLSSVPEHLPVQDELVAIGPNPFGSTIYFNFFAATDEWLSISITDATGRLVAQRREFVVGNTVNTVTMELSEALSSGLYLLHIESTSGVFERKLVKVAP